MDHTKRTSRTNPAIKELPIDASGAFDLAADHVLNNAIDYHSAHSHFVRRLAQRALEQSKDEKHPHGNKCRAARSLGVHRNTFQALLRGEK